MGSWSTRQRQLLGAACVLLGSSMFVLGFTALVTSCAENQAYANGETAAPSGPEAAPEEQGPAAPELSLPQPPLPPDRQVSTPETVPADDSSSGPAAPQSRGAARQRGPGRPRQPVAEQPAAAEAVSEAGQSTAQPRPGNGEDGFAALEEDWSLGSTAEDAGTEPEQLAPSMQLTEEARGFAGHWTAAVINKDGAARLLQSEDEWVFSLGLDGRCTTRQRLGGKQWEQGGWWQMQGDALTLSLGPGGVWVFGVQREGSDIAIWTRGTEHSGGSNYTLFCVRGEPGRMPPGLGGQYRSDFGPLRFEPTGPGHWRASYGDPTGKLNLARVGGFLAGRWEQEPGSGFVLFKLQASGSNATADSLDGVWWYAGSTVFDGRWRVLR